ncbi:MAG: diphosphate--fructose-6-phosphate 1-phosphotransferase [Clostridiaceae bacterium]
MRKNALVAQSGGPSPVINSSLQGVIEACFSYPDHIANVYAGWHGIEGVMLEELIDMGKQPTEELKRLKRTPAAGAVGTCRYKLKSGQQKDFDRIIEVMKAHDIGYFFYIGGNDSMDTAGKVSKLAREKGLDLVVAGVPKTIDNDIGDDKFTIIDHTPGYGSAARYWAHLIQNVNEENRGMCGSEAVAVLQAMGRKSGYITAAARLADPHREIPLQLYMAESGLNLEALAENVNCELQRSGRCIVVVNEGFDVGNLGEARDAFGHVEYGASRTTAVQVVVNYLNEKGIKARGQVTGQLPGVLQRSASIQASPVDIEEAYEVGKKAVRIALEDGTGWMATILRAPGGSYKALFDKVKLEVVANSERFLPKEWLTASRIDVTDAFVDYARPLIQGGWPEIELVGGLQRFARLDIKFIEKKLPGYVPQNY